MIDIKHAVGQLDKIQEISEELMNENRLAEDEFQEICDCTVTINTYLKIAYKRKRQDEIVQKDN